MGFREDTPGDEGCLLGVLVLGSGGSAWLENLLDGDCFRSCVSEYVLDYCPG